MKSHRESNEDLDVLIKALAETITKIESGPPAEKSGFTSMAFPLWLLGACAVGIIVLGFTV